jgi:hypothetical protein
VKEIIVGLLYTCDVPGNEEEPLKQKEVTEIKVTVSDPENGVVEETRVYCQTDGDKVISALAEFGFSTL